MTGYYKRRREQEGAPEDRLTSLHDDLLVFILSFLPIKQRVAHSAVCSRFLRLLSSIPRLDALRLDVGPPFGGVCVHQELTFPRALIRQCHLVFGDHADLSKPLEQLLVDDLVDAGVQDLILEASGKRWFNLSGRENCGFFGIKSLRSLSLHRITAGCFDGLPLPPIACTVLTSLKMEHCILGWNGRIDFLRTFLASCPFLETLHFIGCLELYARNLCIHSASIKHLVLLHRNPCIRTIDVCCPKLESLTVNVAAELRIEAPKVRNASLLLSLNPPVDPPDALMKLLGAAFRSGAAWLMLNSSTTPNILTAENGIDRFVSPEYKEDAMIFNLDFNLKDRSSTMILTQLLKKCNNCNTRFDIRLDSTHIESTNEDDRLLHGSTEVELIELRMTMPEKTFEGFLLNEEEMIEELKGMGLQVLRNRTSREQFKDVLAHEESLFQVSSSISNSIEMKF